MTRRTRAPVSRPHCTLAQAAVDADTRLRYRLIHDHLKKAISLGRVAPGLVLVEAPVARKAPGAFDEDADPDPLALDVVDLVDAPVLGRDQLRAPNDRAGIGIGGAGGERGRDSFFAERPHAPIIARSPPASRS